MSDEFDLDILKTVKTPRPDAETRDRAMREALAAFDDEKKSAATQGSASGSRLMTILQWSWSTTMETLSKGRLMSGTAIATILAVPLAGYLAFMVMNDGYRPGFTGSQPRTRTTAYGGRWRGPHPSRRRGRRRNETVPSYSAKPCRRRRRRQAMSSRGRSPSGRWSATARPR